MQGLLLNDSPIVSQADSYVVPLATSSVLNTFVTAKYFSGSGTSFGQGPNISTKIKTKQVRKDLTQLLGREAGPR